MFYFSHTDNNAINLGAHRSYHQQRRYCLDNSIFHIPVTNLYPILQWEELICWQITDNYHAILWGYLSMLVFLFCFHCISPILKNQDFVKLALSYFLSQWIYTSIKIMCCSFYIECLISVAFVYRYQNHRKIKSIEIEIF